MAFILSTFFLDVVGAGMVIPVLPELIGSTTGGRPDDAARTFGLFITTFAAMQFLFAPVLGSLSDRYGRRPILLVAAFGAAIDYALLSFAPTLGLLFVGRVIAGLTAATTTVASAYIADVSPPEKRAQNFGLMGGAQGIGFILGPAIGGLLGSFGPRVPFMAAGVLSLLNLLFGLFVLPESHAEKNRRPFSWKEANPIASLASLRQKPGLLYLGAITICVSMAYQVLVSTWVLSNTYRFSWSTGQNGISLAAWGAMLGVVQAALLGFFVRKLGEQKLLIVGLVFSVASYILYGFATAGWMMYGTMIITCLSVATEPAAQGLISNQVNDDEQGAIHGAVGSLTGLAEILGPILATSMFGFFTAPERGPSMKIPGAAFFGGAVLTTIALVAAVYAAGRALWRTDSHVALAADSNDVSDSEEAARAP